MQYSYDEFEADVRLGREIEFTYLSERYSITQSAICWNFMKHHDESTLQQFETEMELLKKANINGKLLKEIWDHITVNVVF